MDAITELFCKHVETPSPAQAATDAGLARRILAGEAAKSGGTAVTCSDAETVARAALIIELREFDAALAELQILILKDPQVLAKLGGGTNPARWSTRPDKKLISTMADFERALRSTS